MAISYFYSNLFLGLLKMFNAFHKDIMRVRPFFNSKELPSIFLFLLTPGLQAMLAYRLGFWLRCNDWHGIMMPFFLLSFFLFWILTAFIRIAYNICLDQSAVIGSGLIIHHFGGIWLSNCQVGDNCTIHQQVCIAPAVGSKLGPLIGNNVWIGPHVKIIGRLKVGDNSTIGAGSIVTRDVDEGCLVIGSPARVIKKKFNNSRILGIADI
jgi:serine acetyltransferase